MRKNKSYWERRAIDRINRYTEDAEKTADLIGKAYFQAEQYFEEEAKKVFQGFQNAFELSESEAKRLLNAQPDEKAMDSLRKALEKITDPEERNNALAQLSSPAYQYRINRLDKLNEEIAATCNELYKTELKIDKRFLAAETDKAYKSMMFDIQKGTGVSGAFDMLPKSYINQVLNTNWSGEHFSTRIWGNTAKLAADLKQDLLVGMLTGQSEQDMAATIMERTGRGSFRARALVRTETTYVTNQAELKSYEEAEIDEYEYSACIDGKTSKICRELNGKTFKVKDGKPGKNLPPMHTFCRSTTLAVLPSEEELDKAFEDFKADNIPEGMDFDEWLDGLEPTEDGKLVFRDKRVDKSAESGIINKKVSDRIISIHNDSDDVYDFIEIEKEMLSTPIGKDIAEYIEAEGLNITINYDNNASADLCGEIVGKEITIYAVNHTNIKELVDTIVHETAHRKYNWNTTQEDEVNCRILEILRTKKSISNAEISDVVNLVRNYYSELPTGDLYGY